MSERNQGDVRYGLDVVAPWSDRITLGLKIIETRDYVLPDTLLGVPMAMISTGRETPDGKAARSNRTAAHCSLLMHALIALLAALHCSLLTAHSCSRRTAHCSLLMHALIALLAALHRCLLKCTQCCALQAAPDAITGVVTFESCLEYPTGPILVCAVPGVCVGHSMCACPLSL